MLYYFLNKMFYQKIKWIVNIIFNELIYNKKKIKMEIYKINEFLLLEGIEDVKSLIKKNYNNDFYKKVTRNNDEILNRLIEMDPTSKPKKDKAGKYSKWLIQRLYKDDEFLKEVLKQKNKEDDYKIENLLKTFHNNKKRFDKNNIFDFKNIEELEEKVEEVGYKEAADVDNEKIKKDIQNGNIELFYNSEKWLIVIPNNKEGAVEYGKGTNWCTANKESNAFDSYRNDKLYIFLDKENDLQPTYQFYFKDDMFMDRNDKRIDIQDFFEKYKDVYNKFFPEVKNKLDNKEKLNQKEIQKLPKSYLNEYLEYFDNQFLDILKDNDVEKLEKNQDEFIELSGIDYEIGKDSLYIPIDDDFLNDYFEVGIDNYDNIIGGIDDKNRFIDIITSDIKDSDEGRRYIYESTIFYDEKSTNMLYQLLKITGIIDPKNYFSTDEKLIDYFVEKFDEYFDFLEDEAIENKIDNVQNDLKQDIEKSFPFTPDDYSLHFEYDKTLKYLMRNNLITINSFKDILENHTVKEEFRSIFNEEYFFEDFILEADYDFSELSKQFNEKADEIISEIKIMGEDSEYADILPSSEFSNAIEELKKQNLNIGETYTKNNKEITIKNINIENGKVLIEYSNHDPKNKVIGKEMFVDPNDIQSYFYQKQIPFESKIFKISEFKMILENRK